MVWGLIMSILGPKSSPASCGTWGSDCGQALYPWPRPVGWACWDSEIAMTAEETILCTLATAGAFVLIILGTAAGAFWPARRTLFFSTRSGRM